MWGARTAAATEPVRLEAFDTSSIGRRVAILGTPLAWINAFMEVESEQLYRGRSILVIQDVGGRGAVPTLLFRKKWDFIVRVRENFEAQMLATYVANAPKPVRIMWICIGGGGGGGGGTGVVGDIPRALWSRWSGRGDITLFGCHEVSLIGGCEWESILFPHACPQERIERVLAGRGGGAGNLVARIREGISEITASGAALVWSNIEETDTRGGLYWYDPKSLTAGLEWSKEDIQDTLRTIADWMGRD